MSKKYTDMKIGKEGKKEMNRVSEGNAFYLQVNGNVIN